ncbi:DUF1972 domain-containing protein [Saccharicrinis sp. 156]|uniref:DUF1972 domain-containing protein n=1 Tax=Saccharicrinis sp. 156 TaxID=3417574 RepID=UPI003D3446A4
MKIAIIGTRGIPNYYGGFEQFAEYLAQYLVKRGHSVTVYNSYSHPYQEKEWNGIDILHKYDPEDKIGTAGQFIYDLNCILDSRKRNFDIILQLGYTSSSIWGRLLPKNAKVVTNMDGLEWKRTKYSKTVQKFLLYAEKLGVKFSDALVADSIGIQKYLYEKYSLNSRYIPYGSHVVDNFCAKLLDEYALEPYKYSMLIARLEPENSIEIILDGVADNSDDSDFIVVGNHLTRYGTFIKEKYKSNKNIRFLGGIYDIEKLNDLRYYAKLYFHGHTVGGTNPSLLEAMGSGALICANDNVFNRSILGDDALYFNSKEDVSICLNTNVLESRARIIKNNFAKIKTIYSWDKIVTQYEDLFHEVYNK